MRFVKLSVCVSSVLLACPLLLGLFARSGLTALLGRGVEWAASGKVAAK